MFDNLNTDGIEGPSDRLGGGPSLMETGSYDGIIKLAYVTLSGSSKAQCVNLVVDYDGVEMRDRFWVTNKNGEPHYEGKGNNKGKKFMLPGFETANDACLMSTGLPLAEQTIEDKTINLWDNDAKKELPKVVPVITSVLGKPITGAVQRQTVNKQEKNDSTGFWEDTNESRDQNETVKFFRTETKMTTAETMRGEDIAEEDLFHTKWLEKNKGVTRNMFKEVKGAAGAAPGGGTGSPGAASGQSKSLFS